MIRRGYIILIIGGALFVAGIIIAAAWAIPFASTFLQENTLISQVSINPGKTVQATSQVTDLTRPVTVAIHIQRPGEGVTNGQNAQEQQQQQLLQLEQGPVRLIETVKDPSGTTVSSNEFSTDLFTTFQPQNAGNHILNITNAGERPVTVDATFGYMPFITGAGTANSSGVMQPVPSIDLSSLAVVIVGGVLTAIGFFTIIAGIVVVVIDSRKRSGEHKSDSGVTEGGITYRKD
jgi:uncharacterized membrane protein